MISDLFKISITNLVNRPMRSKLTIIGIFIGIAAVVSLISVGQGLENSINEQFESLGGNIVTIYAGGGILAGPPGGSITSAKITEDDLRVVRNTKGIKQATGMHFKVGKVIWNEEVRYTYIIGFMPDKITKDLFESTGYGIAEGRDLKSGDRYTAVIGNLIAEGDFYSKGLNLRDKIEIEGQTFRIIGIAESLGNPSDDSQIYIPLDTLREIYNETDSFAMIYAETQEGYEMDEVVENLKKDLRRSRNVKEGEEDFTVTSAEQLMEAFSSIFGIVQAILVGIAAISLLVGGVGIMNSMYTSVLERTKEIGIMKSIGATNEAILVLFLIESGLLGFLGGVIGVVLGAGMAKLVEFGAAVAGYGILKVSLGPELILGALAFSFFIGILSGAFPARSASKLKPVDALRYE